MSITTHQTKFQFPWQRAVGPDMREQTLVSALTAELLAARAREAVLLREKRNLAHRHVILAQEFEHRLINGLQVIASLLSLQSRTASTTEAAEQLTVAAGRVAALGRVHHRLHLLDHEENVQIKQYLQHLCEDLTDLLLQKKLDSAIVFEGTDAQIPTALAIPLGFIVTELTTNSVKYGSGAITVRFEPASHTDLHSLTVLDEGPGLPAGFDPAHRKGLGMRIVQALVKQIGGALHFRPASEGPGACISITFRSSMLETGGT